MKTSQLLQVAVFAAASLLSIGASRPTVAATFDSVEVDESKFVAVAAPFGENRHQLLIIEQISNRQPCWNESGSSPATIDPLLLTFDFTGVCGRSTDSNGYSIRMGEQDLGLDYMLRLVQRNGELVLVGTHRINRNAPEIVIGRTGGIGPAFEKIVLDPGWRFTRRAFQGKLLGHIYLTRDSEAPAMPEFNATPQPQPQPQPGEPVRELIFTPPQSGLTVPGGQIPTPSTPPLLPSSPENTVPGFVVPTRRPAASTTPGNSQTLPPPPAVERPIPVLTAPNN